MATMKDVTDSLDELHGFVQTVDTTVEELYEQIKQFTNDGITSEAASLLLDKVATLRTAVEKVQTDDEDAEDPPA